MVRKDGKSGVRTGNTLRASNSRYSKQYHTNSFIIRECSALSRRQSNQEADEAMLDADGVAYSLNKKGRWALPKLIEDNIHVGDVDSDITISLFKRHKITLQSNCLEYHCNKGKVTTILPKHGYFNDSSISTKRKGRKGDNNNNTADEEEPVPEVKYDVFYPSPITSSLSHNPKYIGNSEMSILPNGDVRNAGHRRRKGGSNKKRSQLVVDNASSYNEDWDSFDDQESENDEDPQGSPHARIRSAELTLSDILKAADRAKHVSEDKHRRIKKNREICKEKDDWVVVGKRGVVYIDKDDSVDEKAEKEKPDKIELPPILLPTRVILQCDDVLPETLQSQYGSLYTEAGCRPRRFVINTTSSVDAVMRNNKFDNSASLDFSSCVVFTRDAPYDTGLDVYCVTFNVNCCVPQIRLENLYDLMYTTVSEVFASAAQYTTMLPIESFCKAEVNSIAASCEKFMTFEVVSKLNKWNVQSLCLNDMDLNEEFDDISRGDIADSVGLQFHEDAERLEHCNICFEDINPMYLDCTPSTCLTSCKHWFCNTCWMEHISESVNSGRTSLTCPEYECESVLDTATMLSLVGIKYVMLLQRRRRNNDVDTQSNLKWCPNSTCGRVLTIPHKGDNLHINVTCACGSVVCFDCLKEAHWPASCNRATNYVKAVKKNGDDCLLVKDDFTIIVRGKNCPKCKRHIEKNGGCPCMDCVCGFSFCWICLVDLALHKSLGQCMNKSDYSGTYKTRLTYTPAEKLGSSNMYKLSVANRSQRQPKLMKKLRAQTNSLSTQLKCLIVKSNDVSMHMSAEEVHGFLMQLMQLKLELNHVIEYTAVFLDGRTGKSGFRKVTNICKTLDGISTSIQANLVSSKDTMNILRVLPMLENLRKRAQHGLAALISSLGAIECVDE